MCMDLKLSDDGVAKEKWLKKHSSTVICYKTVCKTKKKFDLTPRYYPPVYGSEDPYDPKINEIGECDFSNRTVCSVYLRNGWPTSYKPHFHLWGNVKAARAWIPYDDDQCVLKCKVNKKDITDIGWQNGKEVIIATKFEIVGEVE